jgi:hypothetical protein
MDILTYFMIAACYALGCRLSYQLGDRKATERTIHNIIVDVSEMAGRNPKQIAAALVEFRKRKYNLPTPK